MHQIKLFYNSVGFEKLESDINRWLMEHPDIKNPTISRAGGDLVIAILYEVNSEEKRSNYK